MSSKFRLKDKKNREKVDLRIFELEIEVVVHTVIDESIRVTVYPKYYEIATEVSANEARLIGTRLSLLCPEIRKLRKTYISKGKYVSHQIFERVKE